MISKVDLITAYHKFVRGKEKRPDIQEFMINCEEELSSLYYEIKIGAYEHGEYKHFRIYDPKLREIDKATVRDRIVHQLVYDYLVGIYDKTFYFHSYAARTGKGSHKAISALQAMAGKTCQGSNKSIFILKCDIQKFFANIDKRILFALMKKVSCEEYLYLIQEIIESFNPSGIRGIPLGNLTSQIFANIYLNELDNFIKHKLRIKYYIRYMDDFIIISSDENRLTALPFKIDDFLSSALNISLHPQKVGIYKYHKGVDFLGYVMKPRHILLRTKTKNRMFKNLKSNSDKFQHRLMSELTLKQSYNSYLGLLSHASAHRMGKYVKKNFQP